MQLERAKESKTTELKLMTSKVRETESKLLDLQTEIDGVSREKESVKGKFHGKKKPPTY